MTDPASDEARGRRARLLIIVALAVSAASSASTRWINNSLDADIRDAAREAEEFFGDDASSWHAAGAEVLADPTGTSSTIHLDGWERLRDAQSLGDADAVNVSLRSGPESDIVLLYRFRRLGSERCVRVTVDPTGTSSFEESGC